MKIKIRRRTDCEKIILSIFIVIFGEGVLGIFVPQLHPIYYLVDLFNIVLLSGLIINGKLNKLIYTPLKYFMCILIMYVLLTLIGAIINFSNLALHLWGFRNYFSTLIFFVACVSYEHSNNTNFLNKLMWINLLACLIEILLGYRQDWIGGVYGVTGGNVNGPLNILLIILFTKAVIQYINKEIKLLNIFFSGLSSLAVATFAELKIFYVEIIIIIVLCSLVTNYSFRKLGLIILGTVGCLIGIRALFIIFPNIDSRMFSPYYLWNYLTNSGGYVGQFSYDAGDVNRLAFWDKCVNLFDNGVELFFGLGIGNCDQIEVLGLQSDFYMRFSTLHYYMFPLPMILLQQGVVGMVLYILLFITLFIAFLKQRNLTNNLPKSQIQMCEVLCFMTFIITIYDTSLLGKGGFLFFYILSLPFINYTSTKRCKYDS